MKSYKAKSVILAKTGHFRGFGPLLGPGDTTSFSENFFDSAQLDTKVQLTAKFEKKLMDGYPALVRTDERTNERD